MRKVLSFRSHEKWRRFVGGVVSSKDVFEIGNQLVCFDIFLANFSNWCSLAFLNLLSFFSLSIQQFLHNRRLKEKSHLRLLEALQTQEKHQKTTVSKVLKLINTLKREKKRYLQLNISKCIQTLMVRVCIVYLVACGMLID